MRTSQTAATAALSALCALSNSGTIVLLNGTQPATPETALSGNTALATGTYAATAYGAPSYVSPNMTATASFTGSPTAAANGGATFARGYESNGTTVTGDYSVGSVWIASNVTAVGQYCTNGGNTYICTTAGTTAASGGPTGTVAGITDGSVTWDYVGTASTTWAASHAYTLTQTVVNGGLMYVCVAAGTSASSGGPTGTGNDIVDGTAHWDFVQQVGLFDCTLSNCNITTGTAVTFSQTMSMPAS